VLQSSFSLVPSTECGRTSKWACMITPKLSSQVGQPAAEILRVTSHVEQSSTLDKQPWDFHLHVIYGDYIGKPTSRVLSTLHIGVLVDKQPQWFSTPHIGGYTDKQLYGFYTVHSYWRRNLMDSKSLLLSQTMLDSRI